jgi:hypothetical protein
VGDKQESLIKRKFRGFCVTLGLRPDPWRRNVPVINHTELGKENWFSRIPSSPAHGGGASHSLGVNLYK